MITNAYNYLIFFPLPAQILLKWEKLQKRWWLQMLIITYLNFPPVPAQIMLNLEKLQKRWWLQMLTIT